MRKTLINILLLSIFTNTLLGSDKEFSTERLFEENCNRTILMQDLEGLKKCVKDGLKLNEKLGSKIPLHSMLFDYSLSPSELNLKIINYLIDAGTDLQSDKGWLEYPMIENDIKLIDMLINKGVNINHMFSWNNRKVTPLVYAAITGRLDMVKYLIKKGANVNAVDTIGSSALHHTTNNYSIVKYLLKNGADTSIVNQKGYTALEIAEIVRNKKVIKLIKHGDIGDGTKLDVLISKKNSKINYNDFALVIGISKYTNEPNVNYADNSAKSFQLLAQKVLGIPKENIIYLTNEQATSGQIKSNIELISQLLEKDSTLYLYYAGHGVPAPNGKTYLLPSDMKADNIEIEDRLAISSIYNKFVKTPAKKIIVFMDSCFSGKDDKGDLLYKGVAPILRNKKVIIDKSKLAVFSAGSSTDFANQYKDEEQRMFSYFMMKGLLDGKNNSDELSNYVKISVKRKSLRLGLSYKQVPQYEGKKSLKIVK